MKQKWKVNRLNKEIKFYRELFKQALTELNQKSIGFTCEQ